MSVASSAGISVMIHTPVPFTSHPSQLIRTPACDATLFFCAEYLLSCWSPC
jgi:hypothetical protein